MTITATVGPAGPPAPTGTVSFTSNGVAISGCTAVTLGSSRTAVCTTSTLAVGTDAVVATYSGDANYSGSNGSLTQIVNPVPQALQFVTLPPCRVVDTRGANGTFGGPPMPANHPRSFPLAEADNPCGIPSNAVAYSLNVTVVPNGRLCYLTIWPTGEGQPTVSTLNSPDGRTKANAVIVPAGIPNGSVSVYVTSTTNVLLDINGYFIPNSGSTLAFYPVNPCRVIDTRGADGDLGGPYLQGHQERDFPVREERLRSAQQRCGVFDELHRAAEGSSRWLSDGVAGRTGPAAGFDVERSDGNKRGQRRACACGYERSNRHLRYRRHRPADRC